MEITHFDYHQEPTPSAEKIPSQISTPKHVEIMKIQNITRFDTSLERSGLGDHTFDYHYDRTPSAETKPTQTSKL